MQITRNGLALSDAAEIDWLQAEFAEKNCAVIERLFAGDLLRRITENIRAAEFYPNRHFGGGGDGEQEFARDLTMRENELAVHQIHLLLNNPQLFRIIQKITGCPPIGSFGGRIYRNLPGVDHRLDWHGDTEKSERLVGISINFSAGAYQGGFFQIREKDTRKITGEIGCRNPGDAHIFRISPEYQHRVTPAAGETPRTVAAGWFVSHPDISTAVRSLFVKLPAQGKVEPG